MTWPVALESIFGIILLPHNNSTYNSYNPYHFTTTLYYYNSTTPCILCVFLHHLPSGREAVGISDSTATL